MSACLRLQEAGSALANLIFGAVNPSGKLPLSFPASMDDTWLGNPVNPVQVLAGTRPFLCPASLRTPVPVLVQYPGVEVDGVLTATYTEGLFFGYRWYDAQQTAPLWSFGKRLTTHRAYRCVPARFILWISLFALHCRCRPRVIVHDFQLLRSRSRGIGLLFFKRYYIILSCQRGSRRWCRGRTALPRIPGDGG